MSALGEFPYLTPSVYGLTVLNGTVRLPKLQFGGLWQFDMAVSAEFQGILDALEDPRLLVRSDYTVAYANRAFRQKFGIDDFEGRKCHELVFHDLNPCGSCGRICPMDKSVFSRQVERALERELVPGGERFLELESVPVAAADGSPVYFMERIRIRDDAQNAALREGIVARSPATRRVLNAIARVATLNVPVLFCGPGGCGKQSFTRFLHENSRRAVNALVKLDCTALTDERFEDELLGRSAKFGGSRTGGLASRPGGTLYFDEISALSPGLQRRLLTLLESGFVREAGSAQSVALDWRVVCSTNAEDPDRLVASGALREDLWLRLCVARIDVPPLKDRREDIGELAELILRRTGDGESAEISSEVLALLLKRSWPGNIRELECALMRAQLLAGGRKIRPADLEAPRYSELSAEDVGGDTLLEEESRWQGPRAGLARRMGLSERTLYRRLQEARELQQEKEKGTK